MKKILLYSGGMDSWLIDKIWQPDQKIYFNLHTDYSDLEMDRLPDDVTIMDFPFLKQFEIPHNGVIPLRNLYLFMLACNLTGFDDVEICLGATIGDRVHDKTMPFKEKAEDLLNYLYAPQNCLAERKHVKINFDYKTYSKSDLINEYLEKGGDLETAVKESFSCHHPTDEGEPCWHCKPCFRKWLAFKKCGYPFNEEINQRMFNYLHKQLIPKVKEGIHNRGTEDDDALEVYEQMMEEGYKCH